MNIIYEVNDDDIYDVDEFLISEKETSLNSEDRDEEFLDDEEFWDMFNLHQVVEQKIILDMFGKLRKKISKGEGDQ